jgi:hypothetical protein
MEAATPLNLSSVRVAGDRIVVDHLVVNDETAVELARRHPDPGALLVDAIAVGARIIAREHASADVEVLRQELARATEAAARSIEQGATAVNEQLAAKVTQLFGADSGEVTKVLAKYFSDDSTGAVQNRVRAAIEEVLAKSRDDLRKQFASDSDDNPLAIFQRTQLAVIKQTGEQQSQHLLAVNEQLKSLEVKLTELKAEKEKLEEVSAEREKGTAKGRTFEEVVHEAIDRIALPQGDDCEAVGDLKEGSGKKGDVVVAIGACQGPARGRIVFEAKNSKLSRPKALEELDGAMAERNADFGVLVVQSEEQVPAKMLPLREYNGDKLIVPFDPDEPGGALSLQVAYALARARVLMAKGGGEGVDTAAIRDTTERALQAMEDVRRIKQQLTASKTSIDKAGEIVDLMAARVRDHLADIESLLHAGEAAAAPGAGDLD